MCGESVVSHGVVWDNGPAVEAVQLEGGDMSMEVDEPNGTGLKGQGEYGCST